MDHWAKASTELTCSSCGWTGNGSLAVVGEVFEELAEYCCPGCGEKIAVVPFPTREETAAGAASGNLEAIAEMERWSQRDIFWERLKESRRTPIEWPALLDSGDVACALHLETDAGDTWLVLTANGVEIHRELAAFESTEPLARLGREVKARLGGRLVSFDFTRAVLYLAGDRIRLVADMDETVSHLLRNPT